MAHIKLPESLHGRLEMATALVTNGAVFPEEDRHLFAVRSTDDPDTFYWVNGSCTCPDAAYRAPEGLCKHTLATMLYRKAASLLCAPPATPASVLTEEPHPATGIDPQFITYLHGKPFVQYRGLLAMAHKRGMLSLSAKFLSVTADLALAEAHVVFRDGTEYHEAADATPQNVGPKVKDHFARMALTRSKARCLRDALGIDTCSVAEVGGEDHE